MDSVSFLFLIYMIIKYYARINRAGDISIELFLRLPFAHSLFENTLAASDKDYLEVMWSKRNFPEINRILGLGWWNKPTPCKSVIYMLGKIKSIHKRITLRRFTQRLHYNRIEFNGTFRGRSGEGSVERKELKFENLDRIFTYMNLERLHGGDLRSYCSLYYYLNDLHKNTGSQKKE